jgi:arginine decarboxylase
MPTISWCAARSRRCRSIACQGRIAAVMLVPYPPGIPLIMPGERFGEDSRAIIEYLQIAASFERLFPGFENDVHGLQHQEGALGRVYTVDCIKE